YDSPWQKCSSAGRWRTTLLGGQTAESLLEVILGRTSPTQRSRRERRNANYKTNPSDVPGRGQKCKKGRLLNPELPRQFRRTASPAQKLAICALVIPSGCQNHCMITPTRNIAPPASRTKTLRIKPSTEKTFFRPCWVRPTMPKATPNSA